MLKLQKEIFALSSSQGYWPNVDTKTTIPRQLMNIICELEELDEITRAYTFLAEMVLDCIDCHPCTKKVDLTNLEEELADIVIRIMDLAEARNVKLEIHSQKISYIARYRRNHAHESIKGLPLKSEGFLSVDATTDEALLAIRQRNLLIRESMFEIISPACKLNEMFRREENNRTKEIYEFRNMLTNTLVLAEQFGIDIERAVLLKHDYNKTRTDIKSF